MTLYDKIIAIYPELTDFDFSRGVITLRDDNDGNGPYIEVWNHPTLAKPTEEQLA